jgi:hypothetical protein
MTAIIFAEPKKTLGIEEVQTPEKGDTDGFR